MFNSVSVSCESFIMPSIYTPIIAQSIIHISMNKSLLIRFRPREISAFDVNFRAIIIEKNPMITLMLFNMLFDFTKMLSIAGKINGNDNPIAKPINPMIGPITLTLQANSSTRPMIGKVDENDAPGKVNAMKNIPFRLFDLAFFAIEFIHDSGSLMANAPRNEIPSIKNIRRKNTLNIQCSVNLPTPVNAIITDTTTPSNVKMVINEKA